MLRQTLEWSELSVNEITALRSKFVPNDHIGKNRRNRALGQRMSGVHTQELGTRF